MNMDVFLARVTNGKDRVHGYRLSTIHACAHLISSVVFGFDDRRGRLPPWWGVWRTKKDRGIFEFVKYRVKTSCRLTFYANFVFHTHCVQLYICMHVLYVYVTPVYNSMYGSAWALVIIYTRAQVSPSQHHMHCESIDLGVTQQKNRTIPARLHTRLPTLHGGER